MSRRIRIVLMISGIVCLALMLAAAFTFRALRQVQPFYQAVLKSTPPLDADHELESRVAALYSDAQQQSTWQAVFSEAAVNSWLADALSEKYSEFLSDSISEPRVAFVEGQSLIGFRYQEEGLNTVVSVRVETFLTENDALAIRLLTAHAGTLPIPMAKIVEPLTEFVREQHIPLSWTRKKGDPVALIRINSMLSTQYEERRLEAIEIRAGELALSGTTVVEELQISRQPDETTQK